MSVDPSQLPSVGWRPIPDGAELIVTGELDASTMPMIVQDLDALLSLDGVRVLMVNLADATGLDTDVLDTLHAIQQRAGRTGIELYITAAFPTAGTALPDDGRGP